MDVVEDAEVLRHDDQVHRVLMDHAESAQRVSSLQRHEAKARPCSGDRLRLG